jgi:hypothetical protein
MFRPHCTLAVALLTLFCGLQNHRASKRDGTISGSQVDAMVSRRVTSGPLSFGYGNFFMTSTDGKHLELEHRHASGNRRWGVSPTTAEDKLHTNVLLEGKMSQVVIARWSSASMLAVIKSVANNRATFWAMSFPKFSEKCFEQTSFSPKPHLLCERAVEDDILAVSGTVNSPAFAILIGVISADTPSKIESGTVFFEPCGFIEGLKQSTFRTETSVDVNDELEPQ